MVGSRQEVGACQLGNLIIASSAWQRFKCVNVQSGGGAKGGAAAGAGAGAAGGALMLCV